MSDTTSKDDELKPSNLGELERMLLAYLKKAYFNARTDVVAVENRVIPNSNHALGVLENHAGDLMKLVKQYGEQREVDGRIDEVKRFNEKWRSFGNVMYGGAEERNADGSRVFYREAYPIQRYCIDGRIEELAALKESQESE